MEGLLEFLDLLLHLLLILAFTRFAHLADQAFNFALDLFVDLVTHISKLALGLMSGVVGVVTGFG